MPLFFFLHSYAESSLLYYYYYLPSFFVVVLFSILGVRFIENGAFSLSFPLFSREKRVIPSLPQPR